MSLASGNRILYVEQFYFPDGWAGAQLPRDITTDLACQGYDVSVLCGAEQYAPMRDLAIADPRKSGVRIRRVPKLLSGDIHSLKLLRQLWFSLLAMPYALFWPPPTLFISQTNPPLIVFVLALAATLRGRPLLIIAQDLYPEVMVAHGMLRRGHWFHLVLASVFRWAYRRADGVVSLGPTMTKRLIAKGVERHKIREISNWATGDEVVVRGPENRLRDTWGLAGKFVILYSGNLGIAHDWETIVRGVALAGSLLPDLRLVFIGSGESIDSARALVLELGIADCVLFKGAVEFELLPHSLGLADLALVSLRDSFSGLVVPSKFLGHMARGIPTLYVGPGDGDVAEMIRASDGGIVVSGGDVQGFSAAITSLAGDRVRLRRIGASALDYYSRNLSREIGLGRYRRLIGSVLDPN